MQEARKFVVDRDDLAACWDLLRRGSKSFFAASLILPRRIRHPVAGMYAFCRVADDAVDQGGDRRSALDGLMSRLDHIYSGRPNNDPVDRTFTAVVETFEIPQVVPAALLEGFAWDVEGRRYETVSDVRAYSARVAATVGVMMALLMGRREPETLARACDLGVAMQLTNIARDVGEDARAGRLYLPETWLMETGLEPDEFLRDPRFTPELGDVVARLLDEADGLYRRADAGIARLPWDCRAAIRAASLIYADIGREVRKAGLDSVNQRAYTSKWRKFVLLLKAFAGGRRVQRDLLVAPSLGETAFLTSF